MQRRIYLVRHAQAEPGTLKVKDELRTLTDEGEVVSKEVGKFLNRKNSNLNLILASPALRAQQTAIGISKELSPAVEIRTEKILYSENKLEILRLLTSISNHCYEVMIVGHYPTIVELNNYLASNKQLTSMSTGELVALCFTTSWAELSGGTATHEYSFHPSHLLA